LDDDFTAALEQQQINAAIVDPQFIVSVRKKLALACSGDNYIETVWGRGYVLRDPEEALEEQAKVA